MDEEKREIITKEQFEELKREMDYALDDAAIAYAIIRQRDLGKDIRKIIGNLGLTLDQARVEFSQMFPDIDFMNSSQEEILAQVPEAYKSTLDMVVKKLDDLDFENFSEDDFDLEEKEPEYRRLEDIRKSRKNQITELLSQSDLSQIPSEMWNDFSDMQDIHLENTGANIDMKSWNYRMRYQGSFIGCNLISFDPSKYYSNTTSKYNPEIEDLDSSQYRAYIESYRNISYFSDLFFQILERDKTILDENPWIAERIDYTNSYAIVEFWNLLTDEQKNKYKNILIDFIDPNKNYGLNIGHTAQILDTTPVKMWDENFGRIREYFDIPQNIDIVFNNFWKAIPKEIKDKYLDYFLELAEKGDKDPFEYYTAILSDIDENLAIENFKDILGHYIDFKDYSVIYDKNDGNYSIKTLYKIGDLFKKLRDRNIQVSDEIMDLLVNTYQNKEDKNFRNNFGLIWKNINEDQIKKYIPKFLENTDLDSQIYIWNSTDEHIRINLFDDFVEYAKKNDLQDFREYLESDGYIDTIKRLGNNSVYRLLEKDCGQFIKSIRKKYKIFDEQAEESYRNYDPELAKVVFDLEKRKELNLENADAIITNIPKLGKELVLNIVYSNSKMLSESSPKLISQIANLSREDAKK